MNSTKTSSSHRFPHRLSALFLSSLLLASCGASNEAQSGGTDATASASSASAVAPSNSAQSDNSSAATVKSTTSSSASSSASSEDTATKIPLDDSQVEDTQDLVQDAQSALASAQLSSATPTAQATDTQSAQLDAGLSAKTQDEILKVATGSAADDFMATAYEYAQNGWEVEGSPTFVGDPKISDTTFDGQAAKKLEVCVDSSNVKVSDGAGNNMLSSSAPTRSLTYYTLVSIDNTWKIASVDFPDNPDC